MSFINYYAKQDIGKYKFDELIIWWIVAFTELPILWSGFQRIEPIVLKQSHISPIILMIRPSSGFL